jgi:hypothetical protein
MWDELNEVVLKSISLIIRFFQFASTLVVLSGTAQFLNDISDKDSGLPQEYVAVEAISGMIAVWSGIALLLTCCAGRTMLGIEASLDLLSMLLSIAETVLLRSDASSSESVFAGRYSFQDGSADLSLIRACFVFSIIQIPLFASTCLMSLALHLHRRKHGHGHPHEHHHGDEH